MTVNSVDVQLKVYGVFQEYTQRRLMSGKMLRITPDFKVQVFASSDSYRALLSWEDFDGFVSSICGILNARSMNGFPSNSMFVELLAAFKEFAIHDTSKAELFLYSNLDVYIHDPEPIYDPGSALAMSFRGIREARDFLKGYNKSRRLVWEKEE